MNDATENDEYVRYFTYAEFEIILAKVTEVTDKITTLRAERDAAKAEIARLRDEIGMSETRLMHFCGLMYQTHQGCER